MSNISFVPDYLQEKMDELHTVHTQEDLDRVKKEVEKLKQRAIAESAEYRQMLYEKKAEACAEEIRRKYDEKIYDINIRVDKAKREAENAMAKSLLMPGKLNFNQIKTPSESDLVCPKCKSTNSSNFMVQGKGKKKKTAWCFKCNIRMVRKGENVTRIISQDEAMQPVLNRLKGLPL